ncbi:MAG TPA: YciI family protein [Planococcus sp. (in: firmicutes)]|nr:YciI family protein [Planococcus sp. (in: firmicutes)]
MKYFAVLLPMADKEKSAQYRPEHLAFLEKMRDEGHVRINGKFTDGSGGLVIYQADSYEQCEEFVKQDPFIMQGARGYEIIEWEAVWNED